MQNFHYTYWDQLWYYPDRIDNCPEHFGNKRLFTFEMSSKPHSYYNAYENNWWCIRCFTEKGGHLLGLEEQILPIVRKFLEENPDIALEM